MYHNCNISPLKRFFIYAGEKLDSIWIKLHLAFMIIVIDPHWNRFNNEEIKVLVTLMTTEVWTATRS